MALMIVTRSSDASLTVKDGVAGGGDGSGGGDGGGGIDGDGGGIDGDGGGGDGGDGGGTGGGRTVDTRVLMTGSFSTLMLPTPLQRVDQAK